jgi:hypothetical protein
MALKRGSIRAGGAPSDASLEARLDSRLKAMFQAIEREKAPTLLPDLDALPRPRGSRRIPDQA